MNLLISNAEEGTALTRTVVNDSTRYVKFIYQVRCFL